MTYNGPKDNPFNSESNDSVFEDLPLSEVILQAIQGEIRKARVMLPAQVIAVNSPQNVNVQPLYKIRYIDGQVIDMPPIQQVPVSMIAGSDYSIKLPIAVEDIGYLIFCDRDLDSFLAGTGQIAEPASSRIHNLSDALFVPGMLPASMQLKDATTDLVITNGKGVFKVQKAGKFIGTNGTNEMMDLLVKITNQLEILADTLSKDTVNSIYGTSPLNSFTDYANIKSQVDALKAQLTTLKGS